MRLATSPCHWSLLRERRSKGPSRTGKPGACHPLTLKTTRDVARARGTMATKPPPSLPPSGCPALKGRRLHSVAGASVALHATPARPRGDHTASCLPQPGLEGTPVGHRCGCRSAVCEGQGPDGGAQSPWAWSWKRLLHPLGRPAAHLHAKRLHADDEDLPPGSSPERLLRHQQAPDRQHA